MLNCNERQPLLMKCFVIFLSSIKQMVGPFLCIFLTLVGLTELCFTKVDSRMTSKMVHFLVILPVWKIGSYTVGRDIHSIQMVPKPALDATGRCEKLLTVSASHLWVSLLCDFPPRLTLKLQTKYHIFNTYPLSTENGMMCY